jgi:sulfite exporter TauE/SafE
MMTELTLAAAFLMGLLGSAHCIGMCGGISAALTVNGKPADGKQGGGCGQSSIGSRLLSYNLGRIITYTLLGAVAGFIGSYLASIGQSIELALRVFAGLMLIAMGLYLSQWWMGLSRIEKMGALVWKRIQPLTKGLLPASSPSKAFRLGMLWGFLPCGMVYSASSWAMATADPLYSALLMFSFGVGTLPAMLGVGFSGGAIFQWLKRKNTRHVISIVIILMGVQTALSPWFFANSDQHKGHQHMMMSN